jgi:hypothetical protein
MKMMQLNQPYDIRREADLNIRALSNSKYNTKTTNIDSNKITSEGTSSTGQNINRALTASDLGIDASKITKLEGSFKIVDGKAVVSIDMIEGKLGFVNPTKVIDNLVNVAKGQGATSIRIQGTIANEQLLNVLTKRYNFVTSGGSGGYTEYLEIMLK